MAALGYLLAVVWVVIAISQHRAAARRIREWQRMYLQMKAAFEGAEAACLESQALNARMLKEWEPKRGEPAAAR